MNTHFPSLHCHVKRMATEDMLALFVWQNNRIGEKTQTSFDRRTLVIVKHHLSTKPHHQL